MVVFDYTKKVTRKDTIQMKDYVRQQKQVYLNRLKHIQEKLFDYQMQLEEMEDDLDNEERCFTEYLSRILQMMHALKKEKRMDFMIIPRYLVDDNLRPNYDKMLNNARRELKQ